MSRITTTSILSASSSFYYVRIINLHFILAWPPHRTSFTASSSAADHLQSSTQNTLERSSALFHGLFTLAFELIQQAPPLFARSRSLGIICHTAKNSLRESEILAVLQKIRAIVSERKRGRGIIKLAGTAQTQFLCGDFFESTPIVRVVPVFVKQT